MAMTIPVALVIMSMVAAYMMKQLAWDNDVLVIYYYYTTGSNIKFAWNDHVIHALSIRVGDIFGLNPRSMNRARLHTSTALSFPERSVATEAECSV